MQSIALILMFGASMLSATADDPVRDATEVRAFRDLSADFEELTRAALDASRKAKTKEERTAAGRLRPDPGDYARKFLDQARDAENELVAVDALVWVVCHQGATPASSEAVRRISDRFVRSDRIASICLPIAARGADGQLLLRRIVDENLSAPIRGNACLGMAFAHRMLLRDVRRYRGLEPAERAQRLEVYGKDRVEQLDKADPNALVLDAEKCLERVVGEFPDAILRSEVAGFFPFLSDDLGRSSERILRRAVEMHPDAKLRHEAECALVYQQMKLAPLKLELAMRAPGARMPHGIEDIAGGSDRFEGIDSPRLAAEVDERLRNLAAHADKVAEHGINSFHLLTALASNQAYHAGAELLLRRASSQRSLAFFLAGMAAETSRMSFATGSDLAYWVALLGENRVAEIRKMNAAALNQEAAALAEQLAREAQDFRGTPDRNLEELSQKLRGPLAGTIAPEIEGVDFDGKPLKLSDFQGRVVVLDFWNHRSCPHCREAYPTLRELSNAFRGRPFVLLGVDSDDDRDELAKLVRDEVITWRFWFRHGSEKEPTFARWNIEGVPNVIVLDHQGVIRARFVGTPGLDTLKKAVGGLIEEAEKASKTSR